MCVCVCVCVCGRGVFALLQVVSALAAGIVPGGNRSGERTRGVALFQVSSSRNTSQYVHMLRTHGSAYCLVRWAKTRLVMTVNRNL